MKLLVSKFWLAIALCAITPCIAQSANLPEDGKWSGTYSCSVGVGTADGIKPFSYPIEFAVSSRVALITTNNANFAEQVKLSFDGKGLVAVALIGQRKADPDKNWVVRATGSATANRLVAEGPMFRKDEKTLIRTKCVYALEKQPVSAAQASAPATPSPPPTVNPSRSADSNPIAKEARPKDAPQQQRTAELVGEQSRQRGVASEADAVRKAEEETARLRAEVVAAKQKADDAEKRTNEIAQQLAILTAAQSKIAPESAQKRPDEASPAAPSRQADGVAPPKVTPAASPLPSVPAQPVQAKPPAPTAAPQSLPEDPTTLLFRGTDDEKRLKELMDRLLAKDTAQTGDQNEEQAAKSAREDANTTLAVLNSLDALGLNIFLDKKDPMFKRDLSGSATLGDPSSPIRILLLDSMTRIPRQSLLQSAALSFGLATDRSTASTDTKDYLQTLGNLLGKILKDKGINPVTPQQGGEPRFSFEVVPLDWAQNRGATLQLIGRNFPIIIAFDAQIAPVVGTHIVMYRQSVAKPENAKQLAAYEQRVLQFKARLNDASFERLATLSTEDLSAERVVQLQAQKGESDRATKEMLSRIARIDDAVAQNTELSGSLRIYRKGKGLLAKPQDVFCTVTAKDGVLLRGLAASPVFLTWSKIPESSRFSQVFDTSEALFAAIGNDKCGIVIDNAANLKRYMAAMGRDGMFAFNVGPTMNREEAQEPFALAAGYQDWAELKFSDAIGGRSPAEIKTLKKLGIANETSFKEAVARMMALQYATEAADLPEFLADEIEGKKAGKSAKAHRDAENRRIEAAQKEQDAAEQKRLAEQAKEFPYIAILTCGMNKQHINILACFAGQGSHGVATELKLKNGDQLGMYKAYNMSSIGTERRDGFYIDLRPDFSIAAQNSHSTLVLALKILDRLTGKVLYQDVAAKFDVLSIHQ